MFNFFRANPQCNTNSWKECSIASKLNCKIVVFYHETYILAHSYTLPRLRTAFLLLENLSAMSYCNMSVFKRRSREQRVVRARAKLAACGFPARILMYPTPSQIFEQKRLLAVCTRPSMACKLRKTQPVKQFLFRYRSVLVKCITFVIIELVQ